VPDPSSERSAWWDPLDIASLKQAIREQDTQRTGKSTNPFEQNYLKESTTASGQAQPNTKIGPTLSIKRKPPPPDPSNRPIVASPAQNKPPVNVSTKPKVPDMHGANSLTVDRPANSRGASSSTSLMDDQDDEMKRPGLKVREATNEWQVITPNAMKR